MDRMKLAYWVDIFGLLGDVDPNGIGGYTADKTKSPAYICYRLPSVGSVPACDEPGKTIIPTAYDNPQGVIGQGALWTGHGHGVHAFPL
ncbi:MAG: hypothetical protein EBR20_06555, partial [Bacteroidetes bacterium]|nr:hypothetical protein [Bacteroidota bacterium]